MNVSVKLKDLTKARAVKALAGMSYEDIFGKLKAFRRKTAESEFELMKLLLVYEVSDLWVGTGRYRTSGTCTAFEMFLSDNRGWMVSLTTYRRFKEAIQEYSEDIIQRIGLYAVQQAWRIEDAHVRAEVVEQMIAEAYINKAPLTEVQARYMIKGKTPRPKRQVPDAELQETNERLRTRVVDLQAHIELLETARTSIKDLEQENARLKRELEAAQMLLKRYCDRFGDIDAPTAKSRGKVGRRQNGFGNRSHASP